MGVMSRHTGAPACARTVIAPIVHKYLPSVSCIGTSDTIGPIFQISQSGMKGSPSTGPRPCTGGAHWLFPFWKKPRFTVPGYSKIWPWPRKKRSSYLASKALSTGSACDYSSFSVKGLYGPVRALLACVMVFGGSLSRFRALVWGFLPRCESCRPWKKPCLSLPWLAVLVS